MRTFLFGLLVTLISANLYSQSTAPNFWQAVDYNQVQLPENAETTAPPGEHLLFSLDYNSMLNYLQRAPLASEIAAPKEGQLVQLPLHDGSFEIFSVWESPVVEPALAEKYPSIKTYAGIGITDPSKYIRLGHGYDGFHAVILGNNESSAITWYATDQYQYYVCFAPSDFELISDAFSPTHYCGTSDENLGLIDHGTMPAETPIGFRGGGEGNLVTRFDYRVALSCTGEYAVSHGGTVQSVMSSFVTAINTLNTITERDADVHMFLVAASENLIFLNAQSDPYPVGNVGGELIQINTDIVNGIIGIGAYDVGQVMTGSCTDVGGVVSGANTCSQSKGAGTTCHFGSNVVATMLGTGAHEFGHQLGAGHTWNHCPGNEGQRSSDSAWEPGSGSTILSYQGACGISNISGSDNVAYHSGTTGEIWSFIHTGNGTFCGQTVTTSNHSPVITLPYNDGFYIPIATPFELTASATDEDGDEILYTWQQYNLGPAIALGQQVSTSPSFRVYDPSTNPTRVFPRLQTIISNGTNPHELLPTYTRNLKFRCLAKDNNIVEQAGGLTWADVSFEATETAGPFRVTFPDVNTTAMKAGQAVEITWNVANTDNNLVNCRAVNIKLSLDGGNTYPYTLACTTPNDGIETVFLPDVTSNTTRIRVEAADNIFFDISNQNFVIEGSDEPSFSFSLCSQIQQICVPDDAVVEFQTGAVFGFDEPVTFEVLSGLPTGVTVDFNQNPVMPGENAIATFDMSSVTADGNYVVDVRAIAGEDTILRKLFFNIVYSDFSTLSGTGPVDGQSGLGLLPSFTWTDLPHADLYEFQLASQPSFADSTILDEYTGTNASYTPTDVSLLESKIYYWRVRAFNECGASEYAPTSAFQTYTVSCAGFPSADVPKNISDVGLPTVVSELPIIQSGTITDLNVKNLKGTHDALADLEVTLTSPAGTNVTLFKQICGNVSQFNMNLNDEAPFNIACPPINGQNFKPQNPLSAFIGENTLGTWKLTVQVINSIGQGGVLNSWAVEFCGSISPIGPLLIKNDTIYVKPLATRHIYNFELKVEDANTPDENLTFRIVNNTQHGQMIKSGVPLGIGSTFTMSDVHSQKVAYVNTNPDATYDYFTFIVEDGTGGWLGTPRFNIVIDENATTDVDEQDFANSIQLYPNPASQVLNVAFQQPLSAGSMLFVSDVQGRMLYSQQIGAGEQLLQLNTNDYASGIYFLTVKSPEGVIAKKFLIQQ